MIFLYIVCEAYFGGACPGGELIKTPALMFVCLAIRHVSGKHPELSPTATSILQTEKHNHYDLESRCIILEMGWENCVSDIEENIATSSLSLAWATII